MTGFSVCPLSPFKKFKIQINKKKIYETVDRTR